MTEIIMDIDAIHSYLITTLRTEKVKVREADRIITIMPMDNTESEKEIKKFSCPFLGVAVGSNLTVDKFLELKRGERDAEYEKDLRS